MQNRNDADDDRRFKRDGFNELAGCQNLFPANDRYRAIADVQKIIAQKQYLVDLMAQILMIRNQRRYEDVTVPVADPAYDHDDKNGH